jgi:hypothetical protein
MNTHQVLPCIIVGAHPLDLDSIEISRGRGAGLPTNEGQTSQYRKALSVNNLDKNGWNMPSFVQYLMVAALLVPSPLLLVLSLLLGPFLLEDRLP